MTGYTTYFIVCSFSRTGKHCLNIFIIASSIFQPRRTKTN